MYLYSPILSHCISSCLSYSTSCKCFCWFLNKSSSQKKKCMRKIIYKSRWCARCSHLGEKFGLMELVDLLWLRNFSNQGMTSHEMEYDRIEWKTIHVENKGVWHEITEHCSRIKWQRTGIFKYEQLSSENIHFFMFHLHRLLFVLNLLRNCHSHKAD